MVQANQLINPIGFTLYYKNYVNLNTIYLDDGYPALPLYLEFFNLSDQEIQLSAPPANSARNTVNQCHFYLRIPQGVLKIADPSSIISNDNWQVVYVPASTSSQSTTSPPPGGATSLPPGGATSLPPGGATPPPGGTTSSVNTQPGAVTGYDTIYISRNTARTITANNPTSPEDSSSKIILILNQIHAASGVQSRSSSIRLGYGGLTRYQDSATANTTSLVNEGYNHSLFIINHLGKKQIPLHAGFTGSNTILNDGGTANELKLQITNIQNSSNPRPSLVIDKNSRFILSFESGDLTKEWALAEPDEISGIDITATDQVVVIDSSTEPIKWDLQPETNSNRWILKLPRGTDSIFLDSGKAIELKITNIRSAHPSGQTKLTIRYEEIPDYWDGDLVCIIEKTPLMYRSPLKATADNQVLTAVRIKTNFDTSNGDGGHFSGVKKVGLAVENGNVGIGTTTPNYKLDVNGNTNVNGTIYRGGNPLSYENYEIYLRGSGVSSSEGDNNYLKIANVSMPMTSNRGINTVILNPDGSYKTGISHDVYYYLNKWNDWADWINDPSNVANGDVVAVASKDSLGTVSEGGSAETLLRSINALNAFGSCGYRTPYALLFIRGKAGAIEVTQPHQGLNAHLKTTYYELFNYGNSSVVLTRMIVMWSGKTDEIPVGWALCDGDNDTPNLTDRFIVGAGSSYQVNATGGEDTVTLTEQQMPSHSHSGSAQSSEHKHIIPVDTGGGGEGWGQHRMLQTNVYNSSTAWANANTYGYTLQSSPAEWTDNSAPTGGRGEHTHNLAIAQRGHGEGHENRPLYYALAYIMKL